MKALLLIDLQNDFCEGGSLAVRGGNETIPVANRLIPLFDWVIATRDAHPADHQSFAANHPGKEIYQHIDLDGLDQVLWPVHCVEGSPGAIFHPSLDAEKIRCIVKKGTDARIDSYSGFFDNGHRKQTELAKVLNENAIDELFIMGLATDYCVKWTALDARELGFAVHLVEDGCRGVELNPGDCERAILEMEEAGVSITSSAQVIALHG